jgi:DNA polymerase-3 subunit delta'
MSETGNGPPQPRANPYLAGHEEAERVLLNAWHSERMPHAWLICGPRGVGKETLAYRFARFVLTGGEAEANLFGDAPTSLAVDPENPVFRRVASGGHPDLLTVEREVDPKHGHLRGEIVVGAARRIAGFLAMTPGEGGWRVVVVDGAEEMTRSAANAILKAVEEPPARTLIFLVSHVSGRVLPTIRSRCRRLVVKPLAVDAVDRVIGEWRDDLAEEERRALARLSAGSVGAALRLAEEGGLALYTDMIAILGTLPRLDVEAAHAFAGRFARRDAGPTYRTAMDLLAGWIARMVHAAVHGVDLEEAVAGEAEVARTLSGQRPLDQWVQLWEKIQRLVARADAVNLERRQVVLSSLLSLVARSGT